MRPFQVSYLALGALLALVAGVAAAEWGLGPIDEAVGRADASTEIQAGVQSAPATAPGGSSRPVDDAPVAHPSDPPAIVSSIADVRPPSPIVVADEADAVSMKGEMDAPPTAMGANVDDGDYSQGDFTPTAAPN